MLQLRLENILLRSERGMLPGDQTDDEKETQQQQIVTLKRENEALRKRLDALEQKWPVYRESRIEAQAIAPHFWFCRRLAKRGVV